MYLPRFKTTKARYTTGSEYAIRATGEDYVGYYIISSEGVPYSGRQFIQNSSQELIAQVAEIPVESLERFVRYTDYDEIRKKEDEYKLRSTIPLPVYTFIPDFEYEINKRFFAKSKVTQAIIEISREDYLELSKKTLKYHYPSYDTVMVDWYVRGAVGDFQNGSYLIEGIRTKNTREVQKANKVMPGLSQVLTNPLQGIA